MTPPLSTDAIWTHLSSDLRRFIRRRVSDDHIADDLLQETFVRVHHKLDTLRATDRLAAWVYQIARNVIHDHHRQPQHILMSLADHDIAEGVDHQLQLPCQAAGWLDEMIRSLPAGYRAAVQMSEIDGLSQQAVADQLGLSLSGAKSRIQRGRAMLRDVLQQCCHFEFDMRGNLLDYHPKPDRKVCHDCDDSTPATEMVCGGGEIPRLACPIVGSACADSTVGQANPATRGKEKTETA